MIPMKNPQSTFEDDFHRHEFYEDDDHIATMEFDNLSDERTGLFCEVTVYYHVDGRAEPVISFERANLHAKTTGSFNSIANRLTDKIDKVNWKEAIETAGNSSVIQYRTSSSQGGFIDVLDPHSKDAKDPYLLSPLIAATGTSIIYGKQGSGKSMLVLRACLTVITGLPLLGEVPQKTGPILYVDFEDTPEPHQYRMYAMAEGMGINPKELNGMVYHERVTRSMKDTQRRLRRIIREEGIVMVAIDSIGLARAADVSGSEATIKLFKMFASLDEPVLAVDHMTKENNERAAKGLLKEEEMSPIGSVFTETSARLGWGVVLMPQSNAKRKVLNLYNTKHNHMPEMEPISLDIDMEWNDKSLLTKVTFSRRNKFAMAVLTSNRKLSNVQNLLVYHFTQQRKDGKVIPMTFKQLAQGSGIPYGSVSSYVGSRHTDWWERLDGTMLYILSPDGLEMAMLYASLVEKGAEKGVENEG